MTDSVDSGDSKALKKGKPSVEPKPVETPQLSADEDKEDGIGSLYLATLLDALGAFMLLPLIPFIAKEMNATAEEQGYMSGAYAFMQFVFTPVLGTVSDIVGRKRVLLLTLGGCSGSLFITAVVQTPGQLILARAFHGAFASTVSICEAVVADRSTPENRAQNVAKVMGFFAMGMLAGPAIGGFLGSFGLKTLCLTAGGITAFNVWWLWVQLPAPPEVDPAAEDEEDMSKLVSLLQDSGIDISKFGKNQARTLSDFVSEIQTERAVVHTDRLVEDSGPSFEETLKIVTSPRAVILFGLTFIQTAYVGVSMGIGGYYMIDVFDWGKTQMTVSVIVNAVCMIVFQVLLTGPIVTLFGESGSTIVGNVLRIFSALLLMSSRSPSTPWLSGILSTLTAAFIDPCMASMVAGLSGESNRGSVMGVYQSMRSLGEVFGPTMAGQMYQHERNLPIMFQVVLAAISCLVPRRLGKSLESIGLTESRRTKAPRPWRRLGIIFCALFLCSGLSPGMMVWVDVLAGRGAFLNLCDPKNAAPGTSLDPDSFYCDRQYMAAVAAFVGGNFIASFSIVPMLTWADKYGPLTISAIGGGLCVMGYLLMMLTLLLTKLGLPGTVVIVCLFIAVSIADSGAKLAATALQAFAWHFDGSRVVVFLLAMLVYGITGIVPVLVIGITNWLGITAIFQPLFFLTCLVAGGVVTLWNFTPTPEEYYQLANDMLGVPLTQFTASAPRLDQVLGSANRILRKHMPRHMIFVLVLSLITNWVTMYQGFIGNYGLDLASDIASDLGHGRSSGRELVILLTIVMCICSSMFSIFGIVLYELYGWLAMLFMVVTLHGLSFSAIGARSWGGQIFTAVCGSVCKSMVIVIQGKYLGCYAPPKKLAAVTCILECYTSTASVLLMVVSLLLIDHLGKVKAYVILVATSGIILLIYAAYSSFVGLPRSPVLLREEERELCESYGCSCMAEVLTVMGLDDREDVLQLLSSSDREVQSALLMSIKADLLEDNLYQQGTTTLVSMLKRGFAWTQGSSALANMRMLQGAPGSFAITPHLWSQFWKREVDTTMFGEKTSDETQSEAASAKAAAQAASGTPAIRTVNVVLIRVSFGSNENRRYCVQCSEELPDGRTIEKMQLPGAKKSNEDSREECVRRNMAKVGMTDVQVDFDYEKTELVEEQYESPSYPGVLTLYRKEIISGAVVEEDPAVLARIGLPEGAEWTAVDEANMKRRAQWMSPAEMRKNKVWMNKRSEAERRSKESGNDLTSAEAAQTLSEKQAAHLAYVIGVTDRIGRSLQARKYTKSLVKHLRSGSKANLLQWMRSESADGVCEAFEDLDGWLGEEAKFLVRKCLEILDREDLVELLKKRVQLKQMIIFLMKWELISYQSLAQQK